MLNFNNRKEEQIMYIPKELILILIGYFLCPITAYIYLEIKRYKENRKKDD